MKIIAVVALVLALGPIPGLAAQTAQGASPAAAPDAAQGSSGGLDDLFSNTSDTVAAPPTGSALASLETNQPMTFTGKIYAMVAGAAGYASTPSPYNPLDGLVPIGGGSVTNYIYIDARPDPSFRFHGALEMAFPGFTPTMSELWFDYSMADVIFFRGGRQIIGWGNNRIFAAGDLMDNSSTSLSLKTYLPFGSNGLTLVTMVQDPGALGSVAGLKPELAPRLDLVIGSFEFSEAGTYQVGSTKRWASIVKTSHFGAEFYAEAFGTWALDSNPTVSSFESLFWQTQNQKLSFYAEHWYNGSSVYEADHRIALLGSLKIDGVTLGLQWNHAFADGSGQVMPAVTFHPFNHLTVTLGLPVSYGADGSIYAGQEPADFNSPVYNPQNLTNPNLASPISAWNQRYSVFLKIALETSY
ncbi:MAG: hypothetical protein ABSF43_01845 [Rectinemataceae bacterium]|jgi:hypothetical protein